MAQDTPSDPVTRLNRLDCCAVSDAMDKLGLKGSVSGLDQRASTRRIAGRIVTFKLVKAEDAPATTGAPRHLGTTAIEAAQPGDIIVSVNRKAITNVDEFTEAMKDTERQTALFIKRGGEDVLLIVQ